MAKALALCSVCAGPVRQQIDSLLLLGYRADKIVQKLESAALTAKDIIVHRRRLHAGANKATLIVTAVGVMQELRRIDAELTLW